MRTRRLTSLFADAFLDSVCPDKSLCRGALSRWFISASASSDWSRSCAEEVKLHNGHPEGGHIQKGQLSFTDGSTTSAAGARPVKSLGHFRMAFYRCVCLIDCLHVRYHDKTHLHIARVRACVSRNCRGREVLCDNQNLSFRNQLTVFVWQLLEKTNEFHVLVVPIFFKILGLLKSFKVDFHVVSKSFGNSFSFGIYLAVIDYLVVAKSF